MLFQEEAAKHKLKATDAGFSLVELMIAIAIIGMLASMATTSFNQFVASARTSEAKAQLGSAFLAEQSFYAENGSYTTCLEGAGYEPATGAAYYAEGFPNDFYDCAASGNQDCNGDGWSSIICSAPTVGVLGAPAASWWTASTGAGGIPAGCVDAPCTVINYGDLPNGFVSTTSFTIFASGRLSSTDGLLDQWSVDNNDNLIHAQQGY